MTGEQIQLFAYQPRPVKGMERTTPMQIAALLARAQRPDYADDSIADLELRHTRALTQPLRLCVALRYVVGLSTSATADAMGISEPGVIAMLYRARESLRTEPVTPRQADASEPGAGHG